VRETAQGVIHGVQPAVARPRPELLGAAVGAGVDGRTPTMRIDPDQMLVPVDPDLFSHHVNGGRKSLTVGGQPLGGYTSFGDLR